MKKSVLTCIGAAILSTSITVVADDSSIVYVSKVRDLQDIQTRFLINANDGRAWINLVANRPFEEKPYVRQILVDGLRYDANSQNVLLSVNGKDIICGTATERGVGPFKSLRVNANGQCQINTELVTRDHDNGFAVRQEHVIQVRLVPASA